MQGVLSPLQLTASSRTRLDRALEIAGPNDIMVPSSGFTVHVPPVLDGIGQPVAEADVGAKYLEQSGIERERIFPESFSRDTIGNAYFTRQLILEPMGVTSIRVVTSQFHLARAKLVFDWIWSLKPQQKETSVEFVGADDIFGTETLAEQAAWKESTGINRLTPITMGITTIANFQGWFFHEHEAYSFHKTTTMCSSELQGVYRS